MNDVQETFHFEGVLGRLHRSTLFWVEVCSLQYKGSDCPRRIDAFGWDLNRRRLALGPIKHWQRALRCFLRSGS